VNRSELNAPLTTVSGADAGDAGERSDTPSAGHPKLTTETRTHRNYHYTVFGCSGRMV